MYPESHAILIVDPDLRRRDMIAGLLRAEGFAATAVGEGFSALRAVGDGAFALAIVALDLPGALDGTATARELRARQRQLRTLFTGCGARPIAPDPDCEDVIATPFHPRDLLGCVFELLQRRDTDRAAGRFRLTRSG